MINQSLIKEALYINHPTQVSKVAKHIREKANEYGYLSDYWIPERQYLSEHELTAKLVKMGYHSANAKDLANWIRTNVQNAYERGVFVVTDRVIKGEKIASDTPSALLAALRYKEPEYFDGRKWYCDNDYVHALRSERWETEVCQVVGRLTLRYSRAAFTAGLKDACKALVE